MNMKNRTDKLPNPRGNVASQADRFDRRALLVGTSAVALGAIGYAVLNRNGSPKQPVFIARNQRYDGPLTVTIRDGLVATGMTPDLLRGKRVLLKPNLVEPTRRAPHMTTHPAMVVAAAEVFRDFGARVVVGEAPGHVRDTEMALVEGGMHEALRAAKLEFSDLNYEDVVWTPNRGRTSQLDGFYFPRSVASADLVVSMPKMKTHHWVGVTAAMKNLYGVIPGIVYGWPKNVLHHAGIPQTVFDINASLPPTLAIADGILCMEGDGPIMGSPKPMGLVIVGPNATAVDATIARIMNLRPENVSYLALAANRLGPIADSRIEQRGERWQDLVSPFSIIDSPHLRSLPLDPGALIS
ncbi:MAG: DUF362 domain-containing protein [Pirellulales bacterium]|nr:DUF362 domain-containing protein [Pirellulales bacterium]